MYIHKHQWTFFSRLLLLLYFEHSNHIDTKVFQEHPEMKTLVLLLSDSPWRTGRPLHQRGRVPGLLWNLLRTGERRMGSTKRRNGRPVYGERRPVGRIWWSPVYHTKGLRERTIKYYTGIDKFINGARTNFHIEEVSRFHSYFLFWET